MRQGNKQGILIIPLQSFCFYNDWLEILLEFYCTFKHKKDLNCRFANLLQRKNFASETGGNL